ncbi:type VI secretion system membrane subunit TssM [Pseudomonas laurentiana]
MESYRRHFNLRGLTQALRNCTFTALAAGAAIILLLVVIWWLGPAWSWQGYRPLASVEFRSVASLWLVVLPLVCWLIVVRSRLQRLKFEREQIAAAEADPGLGHVQAQELEMNRQLASFLEHARGRRQSYRLPFYLVLGGEGSGKSSLVEHSAQRFSLTHIDRAQAQGLRRKSPASGINWWISDEAVIIDPPGRLLTQDGCHPGPQKADAQAHPIMPPVGTQARLWTHLLAWLARKRGTRAISGLLLAIDIAALVQATPEERTALAHVLRSRIAEVQKALGLCTPLYIVLTKFDLLEGFELLFSRLSTAEREQLFGDTFKLNTLPGQDDWLNQVLVLLDRMVMAVQEHVADALGTLTSEEQCKSLLSFQAQLAGLRTLLMVFLRKALGGDSDCSNLLVRGMYLTSAMQQGAVRNVFMREAALAYGVAHPAFEHAKTAHSNKAFFTQHIFQRAVYPEAGLVGDSAKLSLRKRRAFWRGSAVGLLVVAVAGANLYRYFDSNRAMAADVLLKSQVFRLSEVDEQVDPTARNLLVPLNQIRDAVALFGDYRAALPAVADAGLYQGRTIGPLVDETYLGLLSRRFLPALASGLLNSMEAAPEGSEQQMAALRVYRMIESRQYRRASWVEAWMAREWQREFPGEGQVQRDLMEHLQYALAYADAEVRQFSPRIAKVQQVLRQTPLHQRLYANLKHDSQLDLQGAVDFRRQVGPGFDLIYQTAQPVLLEPLFTAEGLDAYFNTRSRALSELAMIDQWVLGERQQPDYTEAERATLVEQMQNLYTTEYIANWRHTLLQLNVTDFHDLNHGVAVLEHFIGPGEPLRRLLETVRDNTVMLRPDIPGTSDKLPGAAVAELQTKQKQYQAGAIGQAFADMNEMLAASRERPGSYLETLDAIRAVHYYVKAIQASPDQGQAALNAVLERLSSKGRDPIAHLQRVAANLPEPVRNQVAKMAEQTAQVLMIEALNELEKRWYADVYSFFEHRLSGRYPFVVRAPDSALEDFEGFFGPQGKLQQFQDKYLNVLIRDNPNALYAEGRGGHLLHTGVNEQLEIAARIRSSFFDNSGNLNVQFSIEPLGLSTNQRTSLMELNGQQISYTHGPRQLVVIQWPSPQHPSSTLTLLRLNSNSSSLQYYGPWSMFRLLSRGGLNGRTATGVDLSFRAGDGMMRYRLTSEKAFNPITQQPFKGFRLPRNLLNDSASKALRVSMQASNNTQP